MAPFRPSRHTRSSRPGGNIDDNVFLDGLPVRQWRQRDATVGAPEHEQAANAPLKAVDGVADTLPEGWTERPMPKGSDSYTPYNQMLLRAARMGRYIKTETGPRWGWSEGRTESKEQANGYHAEERKQKEGAESGTQSPQRGMKRKASTEGFTAKRWTLVPRDAEEPDREYLAKRREGLPSASANGYYYGHGSGGVYGGVTVYGPDGQPVNGATAEPSKRKGPPPRKKHKKGPGRGHKKITIPLEGTNANGTDGAVSEGAAGSEDTRARDAEGDEGSEDEEGDEEGDEGDEEDGEIHEDTDMQNTPASRLEKVEESETPAAPEPVAEEPTKEEDQSTSALPPTSAPNEFVTEEALPPTPAVEPAPPSGSEIETVPAPMIEADVHKLMEPEPQHSGPMEVRPEAEPGAEVAVALDSKVELEPEPEPVVDDPMELDVPITEEAEPPAAPQIVEHAEPPPSQPSEPQTVEFQQTPKVTTPAEAMIPTEDAPVEAHPSLDAAEPVQDTAEPEQPVEVQGSKVEGDSLDKPEKVPIAALLDSPAPEPVKQAPLERPEMESLTPPPPPQDAPVPRALDVLEQPIPTPIAIAPTVEVQSTAVETQPAQPSPREEMPTASAPLPLTVLDDAKIGEVTTEDAALAPAAAASEGTQLMTQVPQTDSPPAEKEEQQPQEVPVDASNVDVEELPPAKEE